MMRKSKQIVMVGAVLGAALLGSCAASKEAVQGFGKRAGELPSTDPFGDQASRLVYLDQGWGPAETLWYYYADQGSMLLPKKVLLHLEEPESQKSLASAENFTKFRFLVQHKSPNNPDGLPVGFARHDDHVGLTCAACHTGQINYKGTALRIDGAPALADITGFFRQIEASVDKTLADPTKLARFATASKQTEAEARATLANTQSWFQSYNQVNRSSTEEGYGRLDAVGRIINQVIRFTSGPEHSLEPNAPNSFPLLWDAPRHDYVQWGGFSSNAQAGSLGRNAGEVVGVFGRVEVKHYESAEDAKKGYRSSIEGRELVAMEESLRKLKSPKWPEDLLGPLDRTKAQRGQVIYREKCESCHALLDRDNPKRKVTAYLASIDVVGTDPQSVKNLVLAKAPTGILKGAISPKGERYGEEASALVLLADLVTRVLAAQPVSALQAVANAKLHGHTASPKEGNFAKNSQQNPFAELLVYKARPLNGIWASAPYLHNGSVPTLYDLLLPAQRRPSKFVVGRWEYDPAKVGYVTSGDRPFVYDTSLTGNRNIGHEYGTDLAEEDRLALVEYLKGL